MTQIDQPIQPVFELNDYGVPMAQPIDSNYYSPSRLATTIEKLIRKPILSLSVGTIGYYPNKYGVNAIIKSIYLRLPCSKESVSIRHLLKEEATIYLTLKLGVTSRQQYSQFHKNHIVDIEDKHSFTKKDTKEVITYWNYTVEPMDEYNPKRK